MSGHVHSFVVDQIRNQNELQQNLQQLQIGMEENVVEAKEISGSLHRLERAIRKFQDAFSRFRIRDSY